MLRKVVQFGVPTAAVLGGCLVYRDDLKNFAATAAPFSIGFNRIYPESQSLSSASSEYLQRDPDFPRTPWNNNWDK